MNLKLLAIKSLYSVSEDHDESRLRHHVQGYVRVIALEHNYSLLAWNSFADVALVLAAVVLAGLEGAEAGGPTPLVTLLHQVLDDVRGAAGVCERSEEEHPAWISCCPIW